MEAAELHETGDRQSAEPETLSTCSRNADSEILEPDLVDDHFSEYPAIARANLKDVLALRAENAKLNQGNGHHFKSTGRGHNLTLSVQAQDASSLALTRHHQFTGGRDNQSLILSPDGFVLSRRVEDVISERSLSIETPKIKPDEAIDLRRVRIRPLLAPKTIAIDEISLAVGKKRLSIPNPNVVNADELLRATKAELKRMIATIN